MRCTSSWLEKRMFQSDGFLKREAEEGTSVWCDQVHIVTCPIYRTIFMEIHDSSIARDIIK